MRERYHFLGRRWFLIHTINSVAELIMQFSPESINAHYLVAVVLQAQGDIGSAVKYYKTVLELAPDHNKARQALQQLVP